MKISIEKRFFSLLLALVLLFSLMPWWTVEALAAVSGTLSVSGLTVTEDSDKKGIWTLSGATITGTVTGTKDDCGSSATTSTLTLLNDLGMEATLTFSYTFSNGGTIDVDGNESASGSYEKTLADGAAIAITITSQKGASTATLNITDLKLTPTASGDTTVTVQPAAGGTVSVDGTTISEATSYTNAVGYEYTLKATADSGYQFLAWSDGTSYISYDEEFKYMPPADVSITPVFTTAGLPIFEVDGARYDSLTDANEAASSGESRTIVLVKDGTLPTGDYEISSGNTLLIPYDAAYSRNGSKPETVETPNSGWATPKPYRTLTMADGAVITVNGDMEVAAKHYVSQGGKDIGGRPVEYYGYVIMQGSSKITLKSGANLFAWGYISGSSDAQVIAESGSKIYEKMQVADYRGGSATTSTAKNGHFPFSQYYVQNVEVKETVKYGATLVCHAGAYASSIQDMAIDFLGTNAMFTLEEGCQATKYYDIATDRLVVDVNGDFSFNPITLQFKYLITYNYNTKDFVLPLQQNLTINLNSGTATVNQDLLLQPGCVLNIGEEATLDLTSDSEIYLMDDSDWGGYCFDVKLKPITYIPTKGAAPGIRTANNMTDAKLNINGTLEVNGSIFASTNHASVVSTKKTGVLKFNAAVIESATIKQCSSNENKTLVDVNMYPVVLTNGDNTTVNTSGSAAKSAFSYCASCDMWVNAEHCQLHGTHVDNSPIDHNCDICGAANITDHSYGEAWKSDGTNHWHECACGDKSEVTAHTDETTKDHKCDICEYVVSACSDSNDDPDHNCDHCGKENIEGHTPAEDDGDCTTPIYCTECKEETTAAKAHTDGEDADHVCDNENCNVDNITPHSYGEEWKSDGTNHWHECACGDKSEVTAHADEPAKDHFCDTCSYEMSKCADSDDDDHDCDHCGQEDIEGHTPAEDDGDCTTPIYCTECKEETTAAKAHTDGEDADHVCDNENCNVDNITPHSYGEEWKSDGTNHWHECACGDKSEVTAHADETTKDHKCDICEYVVSTCSDGDDDDHDCDHCGKEDVDEGCHGGTATCVAKAVCEECGEAYGEIDSDNHSWGEPEYYWSGGVGDVYSEATATRTCSNSGAHVETETVESSATVVAEATCNTKGKTEYKVTFTKDWTEGHTMTQVLQDIDMLTSHTWQISGEITWRQDIDPDQTWICEVPVTCIKCSPEGTVATNLTKGFATGKQTKAPTCTEMGETTYTATFASGWNIPDQTKVVANIPATGHSFENIAAKDTSCVAPGCVAHKQCTACKLYFAEDAAGDSTDGKATNEDFAIAQLEHSYTGAIKSDGNGRDATHSFLCVNGCDQYGGAVNHTWNGGEQTVDPKCETEGETTYTCTAENCGATYTEAIPATGHTWTLEEYQWTDDGKSCIAHGKCACGAATTADGEISSDVKTAATCTEKGWTTYTAAFKDASWAQTQTRDVEDIPASGHSFKDFDAVSATCQGAGNEAYKQCQTCQLYFAADAEAYAANGLETADSFVIPQMSHSYTGAVQSNGNGQDATHSFQCVNGCNEYGAEEQHTWNSSEVTTAPACLTDGVKTYTCTADGCGATYTEPVSATGHSFGETTAAKDATCLAAGNEAYNQCETCKLYFAPDAEAYAANGLETADSFVISQLDHSYTGAIKSDGNGENATHSFKCVNGCNQYGGTVNHTWNSGVETKAPGCETEGEMSYTCTVEGCGASYEEHIPAINHKWTVSSYTNDGETHTVNYVCENSAEHVKSEPGAEHSYDEKTHTCICTATNHAHDHYDITETTHQSICSCGEILSAAEDHKGGTATCLAKAKCSVCESEYGTMLDHSYTGAVQSNGDGKEATHSFQCVNGCNEYGAEEQHTWNSGEVTTAPGCETEGETTYTCTADGCGATYTEAIPAINHKWTVSGYTNDGETHTVNYVCENSAEHVKSEPGAEHSYDEKHTCVCTATNHAHDHYSITESTHQSICSCGALLSVAEGHKGGTATCLAKAKCSVCESEYGTMLDHSYTGAIKSDGNGKDATHSFLCVNGCDQYGGAVNHTWNGGAETKAPGCETEGETTYTCTAENCGATYTEAIPSTGHTWTLEEYQWTDDGKSCIAHGKCACGAATTADGEISSDVKTAATCTEKGWTTYTAAFKDASWAQTQTKDVEDIPASGHSFKDFDAVSATCQGAGNEAYKQCQTCQLYFAADAEAYAANGLETADSFVIPQMSHSYTGAVQSNGDGKEATHSFQCVNGCNQYGGTVNHTWNSGVETKAPGCETEGETTYTCTADGCGATYTETIPAINHKWTVSGYTNDGETHTVNYVCENSAEHVKSETGIAHGFNASTHKCECGKVDAVATVNGTEYATLAEAVAAAKDGETVVLVKDVTLTEKLTVATSQKWSFGEYTVTTADGGDNYGLVVKGDLTIESGKFSVKGIYGIGVTGSLTVNGGTFTYNGNSDYLLGNWGETVINGGTFNGQYCCVNNFSGTTEITGGTFTTEEFDYSGEYESCDLMADNGLTVTGGSFSKDVSDYCEDGHTLKDENGRYPYGEHRYDKTYTDPTLSADGYTTYTCVCGHSYKEIDEGSRLRGEASIGDTNYATLAEAVAAAKDGDTVVLQKNVALTEKLTVETSQKWSFGEYTVTFSGGTGDNYGLVVKGDLTVDSGKFVIKSQYGIGVTGKLTVNGGSFSVDSTNDYLIGNWGQTVINDGTFKGTYCCVNNFSGTTEITGGTYTTDKYDSTGEYESCDLMADDGLTVTGGTFSKNVTEYCAEGYHTLDDDLNGTYTYGKHQYEEAYTEATFDTDACTTYTCACGDSYTETHEGTKLTAEASIGAVRYETLEEAVAAAKDGESVVLLKNATLSGKLTVATSQKWIFGDYTVTTADGGDNYGLVVKGDLTIESGKFSVKGIYGIGVTGKLTVNGGTFTYSGSSDYLLGNWGETVINGGTFNGQYCCVNNFSGTTEIKGGSFTTEATDSTGEYESSDLLADAGLTVTGGTFSKDMTAFCDDDHHTLSDGSRYVYGAHVYEKEYVDGFTVYTCPCGDTYQVEGDYTGTEVVARVGKIEYTSLASAVAAAENGETVVLVKDVTLTEKLTVATSQKWSFGEYTVTTADGGDNYGLVVKGNLTIESGKFSVKGTYGIGVTGSLTVNGGTFTYSGSSDYLLGNWGETVINGGTFNGQYCCVNNFSGTTEITGGSFTTEATDSTGEYESSDLLADAGLTVTGGSFSKDMTGFCGDAYHTVNDGSGRYVYGAHSYEKELSRQDATCEEGGYVLLACACGAEHQETLTALGHTGGTPVRENVVNATVASAGSYESVVRCVRCKIELSRDTVTINQLYSKIEQESFTNDTIPDTITDTYDTVQQLENKMTELVVSEYSETLANVNVESQLVDVVLVYSTDNENWIKADEEHFPENGELEVVMEIPEGTDLDCYSFYVAHMFTSDAFGKTVGDVEYPDVTEFVDENGRECIKFTVTGLSPITLTWAETDPCGKGHADGNGDTKCDGCGKSMMLGDLDLDGDVDAEDLTLLARHIAGIEVLTDLPLRNADVDLNGDVDATDLTIHARYIAGIIREWEEGLGEEDLTEEDQPEEDPETF